jgi:hypothetical protein
LQTISLSILQGLLTVAIYENSLLNRGRECRSARVSVWQSKKAHGYLSHDPFDLIERDLIVSPVIELRRARSHAPPSAGRIERNRYAVLARD